MQGWAYNCTKGKQASKSNLNTTDSCACFHVHVGIILSAQEHQLYLPGWDGLIWFCIFYLWLELTQIEFAFFNCFLQSLKVHPWTRSCGQRVRLTIPTQQPCQDGWEVAFRKGAQGSRSWFFKTLMKCGGHATTHTKHSTRYWVG